MSKDIGDRYQEETKYDPEKMGGHSLDWSRRPDQFKIYKNPIDVIKLPEIDIDGFKADFGRLLLKRRSRRSYDMDYTLPMKDLSFLVWSTQGVTGRYGDTLFRTAPSAGALYPIETYLMVRSVDGLKQGIYHYRVTSFELELILEGDLSSDVAMAALSQGMITRSQVTFIWTAMVERSKWKYRERAYRYIYLDAGHICQNLYLGAEALELGCCAIGAFFDDWLNSIIGVDGKEETVVYMASIGKPKKRGGVM